MEVPNETLKLTKVDKIFCTVSVVYFAKSFHFFFVNISGVKLNFPRERNFNSKDLLILQQHNSTDPFESREHHFVSILRSKNRHYTQQTLRIFKLQSTQSQW